MRRRWRVLVGVVVVSALLGVLGGMPERGMQVCEDGFDPATGRRFGGCFTPPWSLFDATFVFVLALVVLLPISLGVWEWRDRRRRRAADATADADAQPASSRW